MTEPAGGLTTRGDPDPLERVGAALASLRGVTSSASMLAQGAAALCRHGGFARSLLLRVEDDRLVPTVAYVAGDPAAAERLIAALRPQPPALNAMPLETEILRRRLAMRIPDVAADPAVHRCLSVTWASAAYVAAPLLPQGEVIGILYADRRGQAQPLTDEDRATVAVYAEGLGFAYQAATLGERLQSQHGQVQALLRSTEQLFDEFLADERRAVGGGAAAQHASGFLHGSATRLEQVLTPREIDVIRLLASGETTAGIAARLAISEATVHFHVKNILRKLRAANRAEAVARYLRITAMDRRSGSRPVAGGGTP